MNQILVTGCNGFIGQHLIRTLRQRGFPVRGIDKADIIPAKSVDIDFHKCDITDTAALQGITDGIDVVIHLAAIPREDRSRSWDDYTSVNIDGTRNLLEAARTSGVRRFVFISTVEAAGFGDGIHPRTEGDPPAPVNFYGKSKLAAEQLVLPGERTMECVVIRLPMIYGPGTELVDAKLFGMVKKRIYPLIGNGNALMEFCYVENAVKGIILAAEHPEAAGELFYISDERSYTIREVIRAVAHGVGVRVFFLPIPPVIAYCIAVVWECMARILPYPPLIMPASKKPFFTRETVWWTTRNVNTVSIEKITAKLGYHPDISINEGCRRTAAWFAARTVNRT